MTNLNGYITIKKYKNNNFLNPIDVFSEKNVITKKSILKILDGKAVFSNLLNIALSTSSADEDYNQDTLYNIIATGSLSSSTPGYTYIEETDTHSRYVEYVFRYPSLDYNRTFRTIGLVEYESNNNLDYINAPCYAFKKFNTLINQQVNETIDIYYRVVFDWTSADGNLLKAYKDAVELSAFGQLLGSGVTNFIGYGNVTTSPIRIPASIEHKNIWSKYETVAFTALSNNNGTPNVTNLVNKYSSARYVDNNLLKNKYIAKAVNLFEVDGDYYTDVNSAPVDYLGKIFASALYGNSGVSIGNKNNNFYYGAIKNIKEPFQNVFGHSSQAGTLFYENQNLANSTWKPTIEGEWTAKLPKLINLKITKDGGVGVAEYRYKICPYTEVYKNFQSNTYYLPWKGGADLKQFHYYRSKSINYDRAERLAQLYSHDCILIPITQEVILTANETGFTILNLGTGEFTNYNFDSTPQLPCRDITQISVNKTWNPNLFYIADKKTGLYLFNKTTNVITALSNYPCYGVDVKDNGKVIALIDKKLEVSTNNFSSSITYALPQITEEFWQYTNFIKVERNNLLNDKAVICLKVPFGPSTQYLTKDVMYWWNEVNGIISNTSTSTTSLSFSAAVDDVEDFIQGGHACSRPNSIEWNSLNQVWIYKSKRDRIQQSSTKYQIADTYAITSTTLQAVTTNTTVIINKTPQNNTINFDSIESCGFNISTILFNEEDELIIPHGLYKVNENKTGFDLVIGRNPAGSLITDSNFFDYVYPASREADNCYLGQGLVFSGWGLTYMYPYNYEPSFRIGIVKSWNDTLSSFENNLVQVDKLVHTASINLTEGLTLKWENLNVSNPVNLIENQFYTQIICYGVVADDYEGTIPFNFFYSLRPTQLSVINTQLNNTGQYYIPGAYLSTDPDILFWSIEPEETYAHKLKIDGIDVAEILPPDGPAPVSGQIKILNPNTGLIGYSAADQGRTLTGTILYYRKMHPTEV